MRVLTCVLIVSLGILPGLGASAQNIEGAWIQSDSLGLIQTNPNCPYISIQTREFQIQRAGADTIMGSYTALDRAFIAQYLRPDCTIPNSGKNSFFRARHWAIRGVADGNSWKVSAAFVDCQGNDCNAADLNKNSFQTSLTLGKNGLDDVSPQGRLTFVRKSEFEQRERRAAAALPDLFSSLDRGDCTAFVRDSVSSDSPLRQQESFFCELQFQLRKLGHRVVAIDAPIRIALDRQSTPHGMIFTSDVVLPAWVRFADGSTQSRFVVVRPEKGGYRVLNFVGM